MWGRLICLLQFPLEGQSGKNMAHSSKVLEKEWKWKKVDKFSWIYSNAKLLNHREK